MREPQLRVYTGRMVRKKFLFWPYETAEFRDARRPVSLQFYKTKFLKVPFPFIMAHPTRQGFSGHGKYIGYCWIPASSWKAEEQAFLREAHGRLKAKAAGGDLVGYIPPGFWGNPKKQIGGDWLRGISAALAAMRFMSRQEVWDIIARDLSQQMALEDGSICIPSDEPGFLAPFEI